MTADFLLAVDKTTANEDNNMRAKSFTLIRLHLCRLQLIYMTAEKLEIVRQLVSSRLCTVSSDTTLESTSAKMVSKDKSTSLCKHF